MTTFKNHPAAVTATIAILVVIHVIGAKYWGWPSLLGWLDANPNAWSLYVAGSAATAAVAGFAGVVLVLAMADNPRFAKMRLEGGDSLESNWLSIVASALAATLGLISAGTIALGGHGIVAVWFAEASALMAIHSGLRLIWLLRALVTATRRQDQTNQATESAVSYAEISQTK